MQVADKSVTDTITESLKYNCSLTSIDLEGNRYPIPLTAFIDLLKWNNTLIDIKISGGDSKKQSIHHLLAVCQSDFYDIYQLCLKS